LSKTITLEFSSFKDIDCSIDFNLLTYRFWDVSIDDDIELNIQNATESGVFEVVWGDGVVEYFDYNIDSNDNSLSYSYSNSGNYNGKITLKQNRNDECGKTRYFSSSIVDSNRSGISTDIMWLLLLVAGLLGLNYVASRDKQNSVQNSKNKL
jgi:hypothetical protein